jgi:hypothetical protein
LRGRGYAPSATAAVAERIFGEGKSAASSTLTREIHSQIGVMRKSGSLQSARRITTCGRKTEDARGQEHDLDRRPKRGEIEHQHRTKARALPRNFRPVLVDVRLDAALQLEERGGRFEEVDPAYTSQTCAECGVIDAISRPDRDRFRCAGERAVPIAMPRATFFQGRTIAAVPPKRTLQRVSKRKQPKVALGVVA